MSLSLYKKLDMYNKHWLIDQYNLPPPPDTFYNYNNNNYNSRPQVINTPEKKEEKIADKKKTEEKLADEKKAKADKLKKQIDINKKFITQMTERGKEIRQDSGITTPAKKKYLSEIKIMVDNTMLKSKMLKQDYNKLNN